MHVFTRISPEYLFWRHSTSRNSTVFVGEHAVTKAALNKLLQENDNNGACIYFPLDILMNPKCDCESSVADIPKAHAH